MELRRLELKTSGLQGLPVVLVTPCHHRWPFMATIIKTK